MGFILIAVMFAGGALGLVATTALGSVALALTTRSAKSRKYVWWTFAAAFGVGVTLCIVAVHEFPYGAVRPGSDYDVAMKNLFLRGLGYCASPGPAALLAALATRLLPKLRAAAPIGSSRA